MRYNATMIIEYKIVSHHDHEVIATEVNNLLKEGWELHGSIAAVGVVYAQSMVRRVANSMTESMVKK
jgi:hypothetical protein